MIGGRSLLVFRGVMHLQNAVTSNGEVFTGVNYDLRFLL